MEEGRLSCHHGVCPRESARQYPYLLRRLLGRPLEHNNKVAKVMAQCGHLLWQSAFAVTIPITCRRLEACRLFRTLSESGGL